MTNPCLNQITEGPKILILNPPLGALAQLVERNNGIVEAIGSTPIRSI